MGPLTERAAACATTHGRPYLTDFTGGFEVGSKFFAGVEGAAATMTIGVTPGHCVQQPGSRALYRTEDGRAVAGEDYQGIADAWSDPLCADVDSPQFCPAGSQPQRTVDVSITNDGAPEQAVEPFRFRLVAGEPAGLAEPTAASIHVVDDDGTARTSLEPTIDGAAAVSYSRSESFPRLLIPVFGAGNPAPSSVGYAVAPGPQNPATEGEDFRVASPNPLPIPSSRVGFIEFAIVNDDLGEPPESIVLTLPGGAAPATTTLTILDNEEGEPPSSRLHHPRHRWKYKKSDYRIREVHVFASDTGGSGVTAAQFGLRRNMQNGDCLWLTKEGWQRKECSNRQWLDTTYDDVGQLWYRRLTQLKSSVGTRIKDYTAFSRAIDGAKNMEKNFDERRNANTFEIKRTRRRR